MRSILFISLLLSFSVQAQNSKIKFDHLTIDDGLTDGTIHCTFEDSRGFIWFGTRNGLNLYDGNKITAFLNDPENENSISGNEVTAISEDKYGLLWIGTRNNGLNKFDWLNNKFTRIGHDPQNQDSPSSNEIHDIYIDKEKDEILLGHDYNGLDVYDRTADKFIHFKVNSSTANSISNNEVFDIEKDEGSKYWISTNSNKLELFDFSSKTFQQVVYTDNQLLSNTGWKKPLHKDSYGFIWIGGSSGVYRINRQGGDQLFLNFQTDSNQLSSRMISSFHEDQYGNIWIGTDGGGINIYHPAENTFSYLSSNLLDPNSLSTNAIYSIYEDKAGSIWVGTYNGGINHYHPDKYKFDTYRAIPGQSNSLSSNFILAINDGGNGEIWIGTDGGGLNLFNSKTSSFTHFKNNPNNSNSISSNVIKSIYKDSQGILWLGTYAGGLNTFDPTSNKVTRYQPQKNNPESIGDKSVWDVTEDKNGNIWLGLLGNGLDLFNRETKTFKHYKNISNDKNSLVGNSTSVLFKDSEGGLWIGTQGSGISFYNYESDNFSNFEQQNSNRTTLINNYIKVFYEDNNKKLWIGTAEGISIYNLETRKFESSPVNQLLPNLFINGIIQDNSGNFWISTNRGITQYNPETKLAQHFDIKDGLQGNEFSYNACLKTSNDGKIYFGGINGFSILTPSKISKSTYSPKIAITGFRLFDQTINQGDTINNRILLQKNISASEEITLNHNENVFAIEFSALDFISPEKVKYKYQLEGFDQTETSVNATNRKVTYTNLDAGEYDFIVKSTNSDGIWSDKSATIQIIILPPWWKTWWFRLIFLIAIASAFISIYIWRVRAIKSQQLLLVNEVETKTAELKQIIAVLKSNNAKVTESGNILNIKSGTLSNDAQIQQDAAKAIQEELEDVTSHTKKTSDNAHLTSEISEKTVQQLEKIRGATENNIKENKAIFNKLSVLDEIFRQTNILAINASIEAASAGSYGAGFSVIAREIRSLAERSKNASEEIQATVDRGVAETEQVGKLIREFIPEVINAAELINQISESSENQSKSLEKVYLSLKEFFQTSHQNAAVSKEIHEVSHDLDQLVKTLNKELKSING